jgi:uncharacterized protein YkwD
MSPPGTFHRSACSAATRSSGSLATPRAIVHAGMHSAHRRNILQRRFRVVGVGVKRGTPVAAPGDGITYTTDVGS